MSDQRMLLKSEKRQENLHSTVKAHIVNSNCIWIRLIAPYDRQRDFQLCHFREPDILPEFYSQPVLLVPA